MVELQIMTSLSTLITDKLQEVQPHNRHQLALLYTSDFETNYEPKTSSGKLHETLHNICVWEIAPLYILSIQKQHYEIDLAKFDTDFNYYYLYKCLT